MSAFYRNRETGIVQVHPQSGLGDFFNSEEIGEDGKAVKPFIPLGASTDEARRRADLAKDPDKTPDADGNGSANKQKGI